MTATFVDLYYTVTGKTIAVFTTGGKRRSLNCETWTHGVPTLMDVSRLRIDTALVRASRRRRQIGPKSVFPALSLTLANGHTLNEVVVRHERFVHLTGTGLIAVKHDNPDAHLNVVVYGEDSHSPWATCSAPCSQSGPVADYRLVGNSLNVTPVDRPVNKTHPMWVLDFVTGEHLVAPKSVTPAVREPVSASV